MNRTRNQMKRVVEMNQAMYRRMISGWMIGMGSWGWSQDQTNSYYKDMLDRFQMATAENVKALETAYKQIRDSQVQLYNMIAESIGAAVDPDSDIPDLDYITSLTKLVNDMTARTVTSFSSLSSKAAKTASELSASVTNV